MNQHSNQLNKTKEIYEAVINKVCQHLQEDQENDSEMAVEVIDRFKELWKKKIEERQVFIWNERDFPSIQNTDAMKKDNSASNQSRNTGNSLNINQNKNELSDDKAQELLNQVNQMSQNNQKESYQSLSHPNPNIDLLQPQPIKKIKAEENFHYQIPQYTREKLEEGSPNFGSVGLTDSENTNHLNFHEHDNQTHNIIDHVPHLHISTVKLEEDQDVNYLSLLNQEKENERELGQHDPSLNNLLVETVERQENKNEKFLLDTEHFTEQHMYGYYSIMKKKTAKKFKISFENIIATLGDKEYLMSSLCGDLEW